MTDNGFGTSVDPTFTIVNDRFSPENLLLIAELLDGWSYSAFASTCTKLHRTLSREWMKNVRYLKGSSEAPFYCKWKKLISTKSNEETARLVWNGDYVYPRRRYFDRFVGTGFGIPILPDQYSLAIENGHFHKIPVEIRKTLPLPLLSALGLYEELYTRLQNSTEPVMMVHAFDNFFDICHVSVAAIQWFVDDHLKDFNFIELMEKCLRLRQRGWYFGPEDSNWIQNILVTLNLENMWRYITQTHPGRLSNWIKDNLIDCQTFFVMTIRDGGERAHRYLLETPELKTTFGNIGLYTFHGERHKKHKDWLPCYGNVILIRSYLEDMHKQFSLVHVVQELFVSSTPAALNDLFLFHRSQLLSIPFNRIGSIYSKILRKKVIPSLKAFRSYIKICKALFVPNEATEHIRNAAYIISFNILACGHSVHLPLFEKVVGITLEHDPRTVCGPCDSIWEGDLVLLANLRCGFHDKIHKKWPMIFFQKRKILHRCDLPIFNYLVEKDPSIWERFSHWKTGEFFEMIQPTKKIWERRREITARLEVTQGVDTMIAKIANYLRLFPPLSPHHDMDTSSPLLVNRDEFIATNDESWAFFTMHCEHRFRRIERLHWFLTEAGVTHEFVDKLASAIQNPSETTL